MFSDGGSVYLIVIPNAMTTKTDNLKTVKK